ncbi:MAG: hypothetical protein R3C05_16595 [Pirellulaceae bacterium]
MTRLLRGAEPFESIDEEESYVTPVSMLQPTPLLVPKPAAMADVGTAPAATSRSNVRPAPIVADTSRIDRLFAGEAINLFSDSFGIQDTVSGAESFPKASTDLGDLLQKSSSAISVDVQSRTPVVHDPRIRSSRVGALAASGSYWVPARADLDTVLSKFDSRQVETVTIIPGPYAVRYGPGFQFTDIQLLRSPRFANGFETHGETAMDYSNNGRQWFGQQSSFGRSRLGNALQLRTPDRRRLHVRRRSKIPPVITSRELTLAIGRDFKNDHSLELSILRLDQTGMEFPGYVFDIDFLVTDGYEVTHTKRRGTWFDWLETSRLVQSNPVCRKRSEPGETEVLPVSRFDRLHRDD